MSPGWRERINFTVEKYVYGTARAIQIEAGLYICKLHPIGMDGNELISSVRLAATRGGDNKNTLLD
jgi:hypothetical protein